MKKEHCTLTKIYRFSAGHRLYNPDFTDEENRRVFGKCTNERGHGHDYYLEVKVAGEIDRETGMITNLKDLDHAVKDLIEELDHKRLDIEVPFFTNQKASGEIIVKYCWMRLKPLINGHTSARLCHLKLWETQNNNFEYFEDGFEQEVL